MRLLALAVAAILGGCATAPLPTATPLPERVHFKASSWGLPVAEWTVHHTGEGEWIEVVREEGAPFQQRKLVHRTLAGSPARMAALAERLAPLPQVMPERSTCEAYATDMTYGTLVIEHAGVTRELRWDDGCRDPGYRAYMQAIFAADKLVAGWGKDGPVTRIEETGAN